MSTTSHQFMNNDGCANNWGFHFLKVGLDAWTHNVQCDVSTVYRYWNNLGSVGTLSPGATYTVTMQTASTIYQTAAGAWIDYNQDGQFSASEYIGTNTTGSSAPTFTKQFTVPCNAKAGQTIIRFRANYYDAVNSGQGCGTLNYGETMDYIINIAGTSAPSANFSFPDSIYVNSPVLFTNSNQTGYVSHEWDVMNQGNNPDATTTNFNYVFGSAGTYQVRLSSTNCQGTAIKAQQVTVITPTSSPDPVFVVSQNEVVYDGVTPIYIDFYDLSSYGPTQWEWVVTPDILNGGTYIWSTGSEYSQNPTAFFYDVEIYDVCLIVGNSAGLDTLCKSGYINIKAPGAGSTFVNKMGEHLGSDVDSGLIYDSGGATDQYKNNEYNEFLISPCGASQVTLTFLSFNLAANDQLFVFDGSNSAAAQIGAYTGTNLPPTITSTGGSLYLVFLSNNTGTADGFAATWSSVIPNNGAPTASFSVPDTIYQCSLGNPVVFTNTSTGVLADQASYDWIFDYDPNVIYPTGYADLTNETNPEWSYFSTGTYNVRMVLKSCEGNDTAIGSFVLGTTANNPIVDFAASESILKVGDIVNLKDMSVAGCEYEWVITPSTYTIENGGDEFDPVVDVKFTAPGSYNVKLIVQNDNGSSFLERTNYIDVIEYCAPAVFYPTV
ncbi:MAG: GEVED domain-containing protein, partial [Bacteroidota bacterium]|nr:GEVED domain-containing protein [Bacteroidota bacterium]MDX5469292.1 GEVED domain-containing protein [Bacteroidota bacterium]